MKVLHVIESLGAGGAEMLLVNLLPALQKKGVTCHVAALASPYDLAAKLESSGVQVHRLDISHRWNLPQALIRLVRLLRSEDFDVVHAHLFFASFYTGLSKIFEPRPKRVVSFHNMGYDSDPANTLWRKVRKRMDSSIQKNLIDAHFGVSSAVQSHYSINLGISNVGVLPNCVNIPAILPDSFVAKKHLLDDFSLRAEDFVIVLPGRLVHEKGHRFALEALSLLKKRGISPLLLIVGDGPLAKEISVDVEKRNLSSRVILHPGVNQPRLYEIMAGADLIIMPSIHEGWPLVAAEALGLAKPLIATKVGGISEIIKNNITGMLIPPRDSEALASSIEHVMKSPEESQRMAQAGRRHVVENFTPEILANRWACQYNSLFEI